MKSTATDIAEPSTWAPLKSKVFRALWIAQLASNLGTWMQTVGAQWMLVDEPNAATLVSLVQTATALPVMLLALPSGVLADLVDRRRLLIGAQISMAIIASALVVLTASGSTTPAVLLLLLFLLGCGQAMTAPAWQAIQPELVPRNQIPAAAALGSMSINVGRAVGPAIAGVLVSVSGPTLVFAFNAVSFIGIVVALILWRRPRDERGLPAERPVAALSAGGRFIRSAPAVRRILLRAALFVAPASALWALLPVVAKNQLGLSASGYGLLLGALGLGAVMGAFGLSKLRRVLSPSALLASAALVFSAATAALATVDNVPAVLTLLVGGGVAWLVALSTLNSAMQLTLPAWVRARGLSVYMLVFMGGQAVGALVWGLLAGVIGPVDTLLASAALLLVCALSTLWWPLRSQTGKMDLTPSAHWPEPVLVFEPAASDGPVLVLKRYRVLESDVLAFSEAVARLGRSRQRTGAIQWQLFRAVEDADVYVEAFVVRSWDEHMRQHQVRLTAEDERAEREVNGFAIEAPTLRHLIAETRTGR